MARQCAGALKVPFPLLVDEIDDRVGHALSAMPDRLYVLDPEGRVVFKSGRGPAGFRPEEMEQSLITLLLDVDARAPSP